MKSAVIYIYIYDQSIYTNFTPPDFLNWPNEIVNFVYFLAVTIH